MKNTPKLTYFYQNGVFGKKRYPCVLLLNLGLFKVIRFETRWDGGSFHTWRTRVKFYWNVEEV